MRRTPGILINGIVGAILGAVVVYIGASFAASACREAGGVVEGGFYTVLCAGPNILLTLLWGGPIGLGIGLLVAWIWSQRQSGHRALPLPPWTVGPGPSS